MARVATERNKQQIPLVKCCLQVWRDLLIECSAECENHGVFMFEESVKDFFFEWGVEAADNDFVGWAD